LTSQYQKFGFLGCNAVWSGRWWRQQVTETLVAPCQARWWPKHHSL